MSVCRRFGVLGRSLVHSHSPALFADRFRAWGISDASYERFERPNLDGFEHWLEEAAQATPPLRGLNVTIPFKQAILPYLTDLSPAAQAIGAVNAIKPANGGWTGHNTDAEGFMKSLRPFLRSSHDRALILGNGGAAAAVRYGLQSLGIEVFHVTRKPIEWTAMRYDVLNAAFLNHCRLVVQCTPIGTYPDVDAYLEIPFAGLTSDHLVVDLVYNPAQTAFLTRAAAAGAETMNGKPMLIAQAEAAWKWWNEEDAVA